MFQRRPLRPAPRTRTLAVGGALAALAVIGGGTVVAVSAPSEVSAGDIQLVQNAAAQEMALGAPVDLDLEPVVARAAGGTIPEGTSIQVTGLPDGLVQNGWVISGTPTRAGTYDVLVTVSNSGVTRSEKVAITVTEEAGAGTDGTTTTSPSTTAATESDPEPTLSAVPGAAAAQGEGADAGTETGTSNEADTETSTGTDADTETGTGDDAGTETGTGDDAGTETGTGDDAGTETGTGTEAGDGTGTDDGTGAGDGTALDLCEIVGEGDVDGVSLANGLAPLLSSEGAGEGESAPAGLAMVLVNAIAGMLPSLLGESGSAADAGSMGQILCTLQPVLSGTGAEGAGAETAAVDGQAATATAATGAAAATGLTGGPAALLGLLGGGTGSLGG